MRTYLNEFQADNNGGNNLLVFLCLQQWERRKSRCNGHSATPSGNAPFYHPISGRSVGWPPEPWFSAISQWTSPDYKFCTIGWSGSPEWWTGHPGMWIIYISSILKCVYIGSKCSKRLFCCMSVTDLHTMGQNMLNDLPCLYILDSWLQSV